MQNAHRHGFVFAGHTVLANVGKVDDDQNTAGFIVDIDTRTFFLIQWISKEFRRNIERTFNQRQLLFSGSRQTDPTVRDNAVQALKLAGCATVLGY